MEGSESLSDPRPNPKGGRTLIVDARDPHAYLRPSEALKAADETDQCSSVPGIYEDKVFVADRPVLLMGCRTRPCSNLLTVVAGRYLQRVTSGLISGITFRYVGSDQHSAMNVLDSVCTITQCRATEGLLSGVVIYGPEARVTFIDNEVCYNRESGIFVFAGAQPRVAQNMCYGNHHFGLAVRDPGSHPECVRNLCHSNMLSGYLLFHHAEALLLDNTCRDNQHWGLVMTPDTHPTPTRDNLVASNVLLRTLEDRWSLQSSLLQILGDSSTLIE